MKLFIQISTEMSILFEASHGLPGDKFKSDHQVIKGLKS